MSWLLHLISKSLYEKLVNSYVVVQGENPLKELVTPVLRGMLILQTTVPSISPPHLSSLASWKVITTTLLTVVAVHILAAGSCERWDRRYCVALGERQHNLSKSLEDEDHC